MMYVFPKDDKAAIVKKSCNFYYEAQLLEGQLQGEMPHLENVTWLHFRCLSAGACPAVVLCMKNAKGTIAALRGVLLAPEYALNPDEGSWLRRRRLFYTP
jgi:hypothetical protein